MNTIAAVTTATGLTVTAVLDDGEYPEKVKISDKAMQDLEERVLDRHPFHGAWNYTIRPAPPPPPDAQPPPGPDLAALAALAGIGDLPALLAALAVPWQAAREQRLHLDRGHARRKHSGSEPWRLPFEAITVAAACHHRLGMSYRLLGEFLGAHHTTIGLAVSRISPLLAEHGITRQHRRARITTLAALREHAAAAGTTLPPPPKAKLCKT